MHPYLMHSSSKWFAKYHTSSVILGKLLKRRRTIFTLWRYFANANLVANHFNGFFTFHNTPVNEQFLITTFSQFFDIFNLLWKYALNPADILLFNLSVTNLLLHLARLLWTTSK